MILYWAPVSRLCGHRGRVRDARYNVVRHIRSRLVLQTCRDATRISVALQDSYRVGNNHRTPWTLSHGVLRARKCPCHHQSDRYIWPLLPPCKEIRNLLRLQMQQGSEFKWGPNQRGLLRARWLARTLRGDKVLKFQYGRAGPRSN